jgi:hypothetical protein
MDGMKVGMRLACWMHVPLGFWLQASRFFWHQSSQPVDHPEFVAVRSTSLAVAAIGWPAARYAHSVIAVWLRASASVLPRPSQATPWKQRAGLIAMWRFRQFPAHPERAHGARSFDASRSVRRGVEMHCK